MDDDAYTIRDFRLESGVVLPEARIAYVTQGRLAPGGRNAILLTHGFTSSHHFAGTGGAGASEGSWAALVGPGKVIDTERYFVVAANMLGSSYGSTSPASRNPATGKPYGPDFPAITLSDIVAQQHALLGHLGVGHLVAVIGPSYGGFQAFQWAVDYPTFMHGIVAVVSAPRLPSDRNTLEDMTAIFAEDPAWNGGHHYTTEGGMAGTMKRIRMNTLRNYGLEADLAARITDPAKRGAEIERLAEAWARIFDPNSMIALRKASLRFDVTPQFSRIKARVLYVLSTTDLLFPPSLAEPVMQALAAAGVRAEYVELESDRGHLASGLDAAKWAPALGRFLAGLPFD
ncbi:MAG: alpha/beta fold hydrolase [Acetobacteraceae bacterium]|nr:alpha/beta fold hydrolase [Acetobacteraceae bacterium]